MRTILPVLDKDHIRVVEEEVVAVEVEAVEVVAEEVEVLSTLLPQKRYRHS